MKDSGHIRWANLLRTFVLCALATSLACSQDVPVEPTSANRPVVVRERNGAFTIHWNGGVEIPVYAGASPDEIDRSHEVARLQDGHVTVDGLAGVRRPFFELATPNGPLIVGERLIPLDGANNFRDLGGYLTDDGKQVRWGQLYRSDALGELSEADVERVAELGIRLVCDFRGPTERADEPDGLPTLNPPRVELLPIHDESVDVAAIEETIRSGEFEGVDFEDLLVQGNRFFVEKHSARYATMFERLTDPQNLPALVHCTGGKDRAGLASALILLALGVPQQTVFDDFLLTNVYTEKRIERTLAIIRIGSLFRTDPEVVRPLLDVRRAYLQSALDTIDEQYGSVDAYLRDGLGLSDANRRALQARLLY